MQVYLNQWRPVYEAHQDSVSIVVDSLGDRKAMTIKCGHECKLLQCSQSREIQPTAQKEVKPFEKIELHGVISSTGSELQYLSLRTICGKVVPVSGINNKFYSPTETM